MNIAIDHLKGSSRIEAAHHLHPWLATPDYTATLSLNHGDADTPAYAGIYAITATMRGERLTLYVGESACISERIAAHFPPATEARFFSDVLRRRILDIEAATRSTFETMTLSAWQITGDRHHRRKYEREALDALGAPLEYSNRNANDCLPASILEAVNRAERLATKRSASAQLAKAQGRA